MDVIFETKSRRFSIEIGFFDTVHEIKEKIHRYEGYPVASQKLFLDGRELSDDDGDTERYAILQGSLLRLSLSSDPDPDPAPARITVTISVSKRQFTVDADAADTVARLKERIYESEGIPPSRFALYHGNAELQDDTKLAEYVVGDRAELHAVIVGPPQQQAASGATVGGKKMRVMVVTKCGTKKVAVEVNAGDNVGELRKELQRVRGSLHFHLPAEGYFFIYKQNVMDDDRSFRWHDVRHGDTIEIFNGSITGGT
ncbi:Polyubiquitin 9 [Ananas comosus]|uniref:Polyubiquitin 9 n=1 Tax=Ananas comosus TaxID=4615 RepID=A0A199VDR6_ANACO|nr:Polyubiquitin 9 [Ananas comosus]